MKLLVYSSIFIIHLQDQDLEGGVYNTTLCTDFSTPPSPIGSREDLDFEFQDGNIQSSEASDISEYNDLEAGITIVPDTCGDGQCDSYTNLPAEFIPRAESDLQGQDLEDGGYDTTLCRDFSTPPSPTGSREDLDLLDNNNTLQQDSLVASEVDTNLLSNFNISNDEFPDGDIQSSEASDISEYSDLEAGIIIVPDTCGNRHCDSYTNLPVVFIPRADTLSKEM